MKNLTWQNPEQLFVAQELINKVKSKCCGIKVFLFIFHLSASRYSKHFIRMSSSLPVKKSIMNTFKQIPKRMGRIYSHPSGLFQNSFISYIFFIIRYCRFQSPFIIVYRHFTSWLADAFSPLNTPKIRKQSQWQSQLQ